MTRRKKHKKDNRALCDDCGKVFVPTTDLADIPDLLQRVEPGGMVPMCECPDCGALAYPFKEPRKVKKEKKT
jgi:uncharacterized OB-fold protein